MGKNFDRWGEKKKGINAREGDLQFHEREIWWCALGVNIGSEQDGTSENFERPVLVIRNFNAKVLWVLPLTRTFKPGKFYVSLGEAPKPSAAVLSQLRLISSKRLIRKISMLDEALFADIVLAVKKLFPTSA